MKTLISDESKSKITARNQTAFVTGTLEKRILIVTAIKDDRCHSHFRVTGSRVREKKFTELSAAVEYYNNPIFKKQR